MSSRGWGKNVAVIGVVHAADASNIAFAAGCGSQWARCVCVSDGVAARVLEAVPALRPALSVIQNGVPCPGQPPEASPLCGRKLRVVYAGRLEQRQKRIHDLVRLVELSAERGLAIQWDIAGEGPEGESLHRRLSAHIAEGRVFWHGVLGREAVRELFRRSDVMLLLSAYEGMPVSMLEAMAEGCVPMVTEGCDAGADLVRAANAGFVLPTGDGARFLAALQSLLQDPSGLAEMKGRAWAAVAHGPHNAAAMAGAYLDLVRRYFNPA
jgi:glycosyltransferase involved in cell wall biosynthesis